MADAVADALTRQFRALNARLRTTVEGLDTATLDRAPAPGENSIAVLVAHTVGSEQSWLHLAAGSAFARDRASEFATRGRATAELLALIDAADAKVADLVGAAARDLAAVRKTHDGQDSTVARCVAHSLSHTAEHVGHAELTRQLLAKRS